MKAQLNFDLDDPEDRMNHMRCVKALDMALALWDISYRMLKELEHAEDFGKPITREIVGEKISDILDNNGINLDELTQ